MNATVQSAIDEGLAVLTPLVRAPVAPLGYGSDLSCAEDLTETMEELAGDNVLVLGQALLRRLDTPRGSLVDDQDLGLDVRGYLNSGTTDRELRALEGAIGIEWRKDDRVRVADVTAALADDGSEMTIRGRVTPADPTKAPFTITLAATDLGVLLKELGR